MKSDNKLFKPSYLVPLVMMIGGVLFLLGVDVKTVSSQAFIGAFLLGGGLVGLLYRNTYILKPARQQKQEGDQ